MSFWAFFLVLLITVRLNDGRTRSKIRSELRDKIVANPLLPFTTLSAPGASSHPLDPLTAIEIRLAAVIIQSENKTLNLEFKCISLHEPEKALLLQSFLSDTNPGSGLDRKALALVVEPETLNPYCVIVNLSTRKTESWTPGRADQVAPKITDEDQYIAEDVVFSDPNVVARIQNLGYSTDDVILDIWEAGYVADNPTYAAARKLLQIFFYGIDNSITGDNFYARPFDFVVYVDIGAKVVRGIEDLPVQEGFDTGNRTGVEVATEAAQYFPELLPPGTLREDVRPIQISQPHGTSFTVDGRQISWQNFKLRVGYNTREGIVIQHVSYNDSGEVRPLFYRMSLSESLEQFGDPRPPYHKRSFFDMGNSEYGPRARELPPHEFCRGEAHYFDVVVHNERAETSVIKNAICVFEEDDGLSWGHYDWVSGKTAAKRSQRLSISSLVNIGNIDYFLSWRFYQDAGIELSVKNTGLLSTNLIAKDVKPPPYGNILSSQLYSQNFQVHLAARIDPAIDGEENTVSIEKPSPILDEAGNPYGNGIVLDSNVLRTPFEAKTGRSPGVFWRMANPNRIQEINGRPTSYKLIPQGPSTPSLYTVDSPLQKRNNWTAHNMWVLPYNDEQIFVDGLYLDCGVAKWTNEAPEANIENTDVVLWYVFALTHIVELEDWPIVSACDGRSGFKLRPSNFFTRNPAVTVPPASVTTALDGNQGWGQNPGWNNAQPTGWTPTSR